MLAAAVGDVLDLGFLGIAGFGVWRGQNLWSHHIELKHERELARLSMDRMEKSIRLEIEQTRNLAEIQRMETMPALTSGELPFSPSGLPYVCGCGRDTSWHMHTFRDGKEHKMSLSLGAVAAIRDGNFAELCVCGDEKDSIHAHRSGTLKAETTLHMAGYTVRR